MSKVLVNDYKDSLNTDEPLFNTKKFESIRDYSEDSLEEGADVLFSIHPKEFFAKKDEINEMEIEELIQDADKDFILRNNEAREVFLKKRESILEKDFYTYKELKEFIGEITDVDYDNKIFTGSFKHLNTDLEQTMQFDFDQLESFSDRDSIEIGRGFLMLVGKKERIIINNLGEERLLGDKNFLRIFLRPKRIISSSQEKEINEISERWEKLFH